MFKFAKRDKFPEGTGLMMINVQWAKVGLDTHIGDGHQSMNKDVHILLGSFGGDHKSCLDHLGVTIKHKQTCFDPSTYGDYMENILETIAIV